VPGRLGVRAAMTAGLAAMLWAETAHSGIVGPNGTRLVTTIALAVAAVGWIGVIVAGPGVTSRLSLVFVCWTGLAGSILLYVHPAAAGCWFTIFACFDAGATMAPRISVPLVTVCCGVLLVGYGAHRGDALATFAAATFVVYVLGSNRRQATGSAKLTERARIAAELHDVLGHSLTALSLQVQAACAALEETSDRDRALTHLHKAARLARSGQEETMAAVRTLRDGAVGVHDLIGSLIDDSGLSTDLTVSGRPRPLPATTGMAVYRVLQEALTNAGKHAPGNDAAVTLSYEPESVTITVANLTGAAANIGAATDTGTGAVSGGQGLRAMRERITAVGGVLATEVDGDTWRVQARVPA
jgi:signal transduction histidine kinase